MELPVRVNTSVNYSLPLPPTLQQTSANTLQASEIEFYIGDLKGEDIYEADPEQQITAQLLTGHRVTGTLYAKQGMPYTRQGETTFTSSHPTQVDEEGNPISYTYSTTVRPYANNAIGEMELAYFPMENFWGYRSVFVELIQKSENLQAKQAYAAYRTDQIDRPDMLREEEKGEVRTHFNNKRSSYDVRINEYDVRIVEQENLIYDLTLEREQSTAHLDDATSNMIRLVDTRDNAAIPIGSKEVEVKTPEQKPAIWGKQNGKQTPEQKAKAGKQKTATHAFGSKHPTLPVDPLPIQLMDAFAGARDVGIPADETPNAIFTQGLTMANPDINQFSSGGNRQTGVTAAFVIPCCTDITRLYYANDTEWAAMQMGRAPDTRRISICQPHQESLDKGGRLTPEQIVNACIRWSSDVIGKLKDDAKGAWNSFQTASKNWRAADLSVDSYYNDNYVPAARNYQNAMQNGLETQQANLSGLEQQRGILQAEKDALDDPTNPTGELIALEQVDQVSDEEYSSRAYNLTLQAEQDIAQMETDIENANTQIQEMEDAVSLCGDAFPSEQAIVEYDYIASETGTIWDKLLGRKYFDKSQYGTMVIAGTVECGGWF